MKLVTYLNRVKQQSEVILLIFTGLMLLMFIDVRSEEIENNKNTGIISKIGLNIAGVPYGIPGIHFEIGHPNIATIFGAGLSISRYYAVTEPDWRFTLFAGCVATPVPRKWPVRPRIIVLYTNDSAYLNYRAKNEYNEWTTFYKEEFPGVCVLLDLEFRLQKLGLRAWEDKPNWTVEVGAGINKPSIGWDAIDKLADDAEKRASSDQLYYWWHEPIQTNIHVSFHICFAYNFSTTAR